MSQQITWNFRVIQEIPMYPYDFQQISTLEPNFATNFVKFCGEIFIIKSATHKVSKTLFFIKIHPRRPEISSIEWQKTCEIIRNSNCFIYLFFLHHFQLISHVFWYSIEDISNCSGWILMKNIFLETLLVALFMTKISP
jgi:hypothetical protein